MVVTAASVNKKNSKEVKRIEWVEWTPQFDFSNNHTV